MNATEMKLKNLLGAINKEIEENKSLQDKHKAVLDRIQQTEEQFTFSWGWLGVYSLVENYLTTIKELVEANDIKKADSYLRFVVYQIQDYEADQEKQPLIYTAQQLVFKKFSNFLIILS